ncbi:MAG: hypothetical protein HKN87_13945 [Saprospiraceae bacterium]|nr:hypothetical protein [Saprospiraceae bacterium]
MAMHSTNYCKTFIEIAEDCPVVSGEVPPQKGEKKTVANLQFDMLKDDPYRYTSDDVLFAVYATRRDIPKDDWEAERAQFFSKGQPCFRASPLTKRYGWGVHSNADGKIALVGRETRAYEGFVSDASLEKTRAMRSKRK